MCIACIPGKCTYLEGVFFKVICFITCGSANLVGSYREVEMKWKKRSHLLWLLPVLVIIGFIVRGYSLSGPSQSLTAAEARALITQHQNDLQFVILDVRTPAEYSQGHIAGAKLLDFYGKGFQQALGKLDKSKTFLIYCRSGSRSGKTMSLASGLGFEHLYHLGRGVMDWQAQGYPLVK
jgi:rhodanese-related sulfurtransferase